MRDEFKTALEAVSQGGTLKVASLETLLSADSEEEIALYDAADALRRREMGDAVHLRGLIEISNHCVWNCHYCGLRRDNSAVSRYRLNLQQVEEAAAFAASQGYRTLVLQGGEDAGLSVELLCEMVRRVKESADFAVTLSVGLRSRADFMKLRDAGAERYLMKQETSDEKLFAALRPGTKLRERVACLKWLKSEGWQVGSGFMVGLPGQTLRTLAEDILLLKEIDVEMAGIGPFLPHPKTPLASCAAGDLTLSLKALAVARLVLPTAHLPATSAIGTLVSGGQRRALECGANVLMPNLSPQAVRQAYQLYPGKIGLQEDPAASHRRIVGFLHGIGRSVATDRGDGRGVRGKANNEAGGKEDGFFIAR